MSDNCAGVSLTVAMALSCQIAMRAYRLRWLWLYRARLLCRRIVYGSYGFVVPDSRAGVSSGSYGFVVPNSCAGVSLAVAMALSRQNCESESRR